MVDIDINQWQQLIGNLMQNSLRYTDIGGSIRCSLRRIDPPASTAQSSSAAPYIELYWEDSSPGVADGDLTKLFDRLFRVEASRNRAMGGSGLGLSVCKAIVEQHGGSIQARHSALGGVLIAINMPTRQQ